MERRSAFLHYALRSFWLWFGLFWLVLGIVMSAGALDERTKDETSALVLAGIGLISATGGGWLVLRETRRLRRGLRVAETGTPAQAEVTGIHSTNYSVNDITQLQILYLYTDASGRVHTGKSEPLPPHEADTWPKGKRVEIRYDPAQPQFSVWTAQAAPEPGKRGLIRGALAWVLQLAGILAVVAVAAVIAELPPIKRLDGLMREHSWLAPATIGAAAGGFVFFMGGIVWLAVGSKRLEASEAFTFAEVKRAWRSGDWARNPMWLRLFVTGGGAMLMGFGLFSAFVVTGPGWLRVIILTAMLYATVRLSWGFWRA